MRKRLMNLSKRCMVAIMSAAFIMSSVTVSMAFPVGVYAENNYDNDVTLDHNIEVNIGTGVILNEGKTIGVNEGTVTTNNGTVTNNITGATVTTNNGTVTNNLAVATVTTNNGTVEKNLAGATVTTNNGTVSFNLVGATVTDNFGTVTDNEGIVVNNFDGQVTNKNNGIVTNQYYSVTLSNSNITAEYGEGFTDPIVADAEGNTKQFIQVKRDRQDLGNDASGQITISPKENYKLSGNDTEGKTDGPGNTFKYELREDGGKYYLTIYNPTQALTIDPTTLGLIISRIQNKENVSISNVIVDDSGDGGDQNPSDETNNNVVTPANPALDRINTALKITPNAKELSVSFVTQTNLTLNDIKTLCETRPDLAKRCSITDKEGNIYELYIPANVAGMAGYEAALDKLKDQPNSLAGPLTICGIFKDLGFTCTKIANLKDLTVRGSNSSAANAVQPQTAAITNGNAVTAAVRNSVLQISADPASIGDAAYTSKFVESITNAPFGGTVKIATNDTAFLDDMIISSLETRNDVSLELSVTIGGIPYEINIPAAYNLRALLGADGKIDMHKLIEIFGTQR